ncbi:MAG: diguanylate cyclase [Candidatus Competibacterales bacterium]
MRRAPSIDRTQTAPADGLHHLAHTNSRPLTPCLLVLAGPDLGQLYPLGDDVYIIGRDPTANIALRDTGVSRRHARLARAQQAVHIEDLASANGTFVNGQRLGAEIHLREGDKITLGKGTILKFTHCDPLDQRFQQNLSQAALRDFLTGVYNRRYFQAQLDMDFQDARRCGNALAVLLIDIDHFKAVNDTHGHGVGDDLLAKLCALISHVIDRNDILARHGGEEFALLCPGLDSREVAILAERIRLAVVEHSFFDVVGDLPVTVSIGVASYPEVAVATPAELLDRTDQALYSAKGLGRNRVAVAR